MWRWSCHRRLPGVGSTNLGCFGDWTPGGSRRSGESRGQEALRGVRGHLPARTWSEACAHSGGAWPELPGCLTLGPEAKGSLRGALLQVSRSCPGVTTPPCCLPRQTHESGASGSRGRHKPPQGSRAVLKGPRVASEWSGRPVRGRPLPSTGAMMLILLFILVTLTGSCAPLFH